MMLNRHLIEHANREKFPDYPDFCHCHAATGTNLHNMSGMMIKIFSGSLQFSELEADTNYIVGMGLYQMQGMEPIEREIRTESSAVIDALIFNT